MIAALAVLDTVLLCACLWFIGLPAYCSYEIRLPPPRVDPTPLRRLTWRAESDSVADILNLKALTYVEQVAGSHWLQGSRLLKEDGHDASFDVELYLAPPLEDARGRFGTKCRQTWPEADVSRFRFGAQDGIEYCISYRVIGRAGGGGLCVPGRDYKAFIVLRKDNLVITIEEDAHTGKSLTNVLLEQLAGGGTR